MSDSRRLRFERQSTMAMATISSFESWSSRTSLRIGMDTSGFDGLVMEGAKEYLAASDLEDDCHDTDQERSPSAIGLTLEEALSELLQLRHERQAWLGTQNELENMIQHLDEDGHSKAGRITQVCAWRFTPR